MASRTRENLNSIYILLFLTVVFFFLQKQDPEKYILLFSFDRDAVMAGQVWRLFTYQFVQSSMLWLFFELLILYIMGGVLEQLWGTWDFIVFYLASLFGSAAVGFVLHLPLFGSFFLFYSLLFVYAYLFPDQTFYIFFVLPVKVKWLAWLAGGLLALRVIAFDPTSVAALGGVLASAGYFVYSQRPGRLIPRRMPAAFRPAAETASGSERDLAESNLQLFSEVKDVLASHDDAKRAALEARISPTVVEGGNICPPVDYKPEHDDRYCIRCEGFAECTLRFMKLSVESEAGEGDASRAPGASESSAV